MSASTTLSVITSKDNLLLVIRVFSYLLIPFLLWYISWRISRRHLFKLAAEIPGPTGWPFIGNVLELFGTSSGKFQFSSLNNTGVLF